MLFKDTPTTKKELFRRTESLLGTEHFIDEDLGGTGAPGYMLERLYGWDGSNKRVADACGVELKYKYSKNPNGLITLVHQKSSDDIGSTGVALLKPYVLKYGKQKVDRFRSFRHTVSPTSPIFTIDRFRNNFRLRPRQGDLPELCWTEDSILETLLCKLRHVIFVRGKRWKVGDRYKMSILSATYLTNIMSSDLLNAVGSYRIVAEIDTSMKTADSAVRDHGTKFRMKPTEIPRIWSLVQIHDDIKHWETK